MFAQMELYPANRISRNCQTLFLELGDDVRVLALNLMGAMTYVLRHPDDINLVTSSGSLNTFGKPPSRLEDWLGNIITV
jgi:hypothetical protein